jgi:carbohydrate-binding DOMON domain-containing protein
MLATITLVAAVVGASAPAAVVVEDPAGDDVGPGGYVYPSGPEYRRGDFDLRRLELVPRGDEVELRVTLGAEISRYIPDKRTLASDVELTNGVLVQNVDIYIDTDGRPGSGFTETVPGRRVTIDPSSAWDVAVVLTPQPFAARSIIDGAMSADAAARVLVPSGLRVAGSTVSARLPAAALGGQPSRSWGFAVLVTGAVWQQSFELVPRLVGEHRANAFTMPVVGVAEKRAFGGAELSAWTPWVIDVTTPPGRSQREVLSSFSEAEKRFAVVLMVYPGGRPPVPQGTEVPVPLQAPVAATPATPHDEGATPVAGPHVLSVQDEWVVVSVKRGAVQQFGLGSVLDAAGAVIARIVVTKVEDEFVAAQVIEKRGPIPVGARVRFGSNKESEMRHD